MGVASAATAGIGIGSSLLGSYLQMNAQGAETQARIEADKANQQIAETQAADALQRGSFQAGQIRQRAAQILGSQRAAAGASGVDANVGSVAQVQAATHSQGEADVSMAMNNAFRSAWGYQVQASQAERQAQFDASNGKLAQYGTLLGGIGGAVGGLGGMVRAGSMARYGGGGYGGF